MNNEQILENRKKRVLREIGKRFPDHAVPKTDAEFEAFFEFENTEVRRNIIGYNYRGTDLDVSKLRKHQIDHWFAKREQSWAEDRVLQNGGAA